jgi:hypothetical protein
MVQIEQLPAHLKELNKLKDSIGKELKRKYVTVDAFDQRAMKSYDKEKKTNAVKPADAAKDESVDDVSKKDYDEDADYRKIKVEHYFESLASQYENVQNELTVLDYLGNHKNLKNIIGDQTFDQTHFKVIERKLKRNPRFRYHRILMMPLSYSKAFQQSNPETITEGSTHLDGFPKISFENIDEVNLGEIVNPLTLDHLSNVFRESKNCQSEVIVDLLLYPICTHSVAIADKKDLLLELDTLNKLGMGLPNHLYIMHDKEDRKIIEPYSSKIRQRQSHVIRLSDQFAKLSLQQLYEIDFEKRTGEKLPR